MKTLPMISVAALAFCATQAMAAGGTDTTNVTSETSGAMAQEAVGAQPAGGADSGARVGKSRAEVYQELIRVQQNGALNRLYESVFGGD
jgi:hypothetical protein